MNPISSARFSPTLPHLPPHHYSGRARLGIRYEAAVHEYLDDRYPERYVPSPWLNYSCAGESHFHWCQPDGLLFWPENGRITIIEAKYQHTPRAHQQLLGLYTPVLKKIFPENLWTLEVCEVVKWFDPAISFPTKIRLVEDPLYITTPAFKVHIFKPH